MVLLVTGVQVVVPPSGDVRQVLVVVQAPAAFLLQRQTARQVRVLPIALQMKPGAQSAEPVQAAPAVPVRDGSGQAQSTWSMLAGIRHLSVPGQLPTALAAGAVGSQLNVHVWYAVSTSLQTTRPSQTLPGPPPLLPNATQSAAPLQNRKQTLVAQPRRL